MKYISNISCVSGGYGFAHYWYLNIKLEDKFKRFYLGQDVKFLSRVLGIDFNCIKSVLGIYGSIDFEKYNQKITNLIINLLSNNETRGTRKPSIKVIRAILTKNEWEFSGE